jgi:hypothetical protein
MTVTSVRGGHRSQFSVTSRWASNLVRTAAQKNVRRFLTKIDDAIRHHGGCPTAGQLIELLR